MARNRRRGSAVRESAVIVRVVDSGVLPASRSTTQAPELASPAWGIPDVDQIARAEAIATIAHRDQVDKIGEPYIDHPARVAEGFADVVAHCAAWLHGVLAEGDLTADDLLDAGVRPDVVDIVEVLTRAAGEKDDVYYHRIRLNPVALAIKAAAIDDNLEPWRTMLLSPGVRVQLASKYRRARLALGLPVSS